MSAFPVIFAGKRQGNGKERGVGSDTCDNTWSSKSSTFIDNESRTYFNLEERLDKLRAPGVLLKMSRGKMSPLWWRFEISAAIFVAATVAVKESIDDYF